MIRLSSFRLYVGAKAVSDIGDGIIAVTLAFAALALGANPAQVGIVLLSGRLPLVLFTLISSAWGGRFHRKGVLIGTNLFRLVTQGLTAYMLLTKGGNLWLLASLQALTASATALFLPVSEAVVADLVPREERHRANAVLGIERSATLIAAPAIAAVVVAVAGVGLAFVFDAASFGLSALLLLGLRFGAAPVRRERLVGLVEFATRSLRTRRWLWVTSLEAGLINALCIGPALVVGPIVAERLLGGATTWALFATSFAIGTAGGGLSMLWWHPRQPLRAAMWVSLLIAPYLAALAAPVPIAVIIVAAFFAGLQTTVFNTVVQTARQNYFSAELRVQAAALSNLLALSSLPIGMAFAGWLAGLSSPAAVLWMATLVAIVAPLGALLSRSVRGLPGIGEARHEPPMRTETTTVGDSPS